MLDQFWASLDIGDISDLGYIENIPYNTSEKKEDVLEKIDWVVLKLYKIKDVRKYDYDTISKIKDKIKVMDYSLTMKGVEYLNTITNELKNNTF
jgi:hypothetical protein